VNDKASASRKKRILVAPLNWGLGHASRCIPIVRALQNRSVEVVLAADGRPYDFLKNEFPELELRRLPDLNIRYIDNSSMLVSMLMQTPQILSAFVRERASVPRIVNEWKIDGIISDNRFGLFAPPLPCIYMTHQITIMVPQAIAWLEPLLRRLHASVITRFTECWIPDSAGDVNLSGGLSHHCALPANAYFIGPLSRFTRSAAPNGTYDLAVVLSGPEPQRTIFEELVRSQLRGTTLRVIIVQGIPERQERSRDSETVEIVSSLTAPELNSVLMGARMVVSRSGYSSVMDLAALGKNAILVPTPGQTEQEYVAARLRTANIFYSEEQSSFDLTRALEQSRSFSGWTKDVQQDDLLDERIDNFLSLIHV
jgi:uncharacterized protein (TIGR00661 family)